MKQYNGGSLYGKWSEWLRKISITKRVVIVFILITIIPIAVISVYSAVTYRSSMIQKLSSSFLETMVSVNTITSLKMDRYIEQSYLIVSDERIIDSLSRYYSGLRSLEQCGDEVEEASQSIVWSEPCNNILITTANGKMVYNIGYSIPDAASFQKNDEYLRGQGQNHVWGVGKNLSGSDIILFTKCIYSADGELIGYLHFVFDENLLFKDVYKNLNDNVQSESFIVNYDMTYMSTQSSDERLGTLIQNDIPDVEEILKENGSGSFIADYCGKESLILYNKNKDYQNFFFTVIDMSYINDDIRMMIRNISIVAILLIVACIAVILAICSTIITPINNLVQYSNKIVNKEYDARINLSGKDEMTDLSENMKTTVDELVRLLKENQENNKRERELELRMLQYQINPHFMFNTLNTFKTIALLNEVYTISDGITAFSDLIQQTIMKTDGIIPLEQEIKNIQNYIYIQQFKYAGTFEVEYQLEEATLSCGVPRLFIQPIVENSILHGSEKNVLLTIRIKSVKIDDEVEISIEDDGKGFSPSPTPQNSKYHFSGIGLDNVRERLSLMYEGKAQFHLYSEEGKGTKVVIRLPWSKGEQHV